MTFLTAIVRTQGRRPRSLDEALASLAHQTDDDLEVIVVVHGDHDALNQVSKQVDDSIRVLGVEGGGRSAPLNAGIDAATGDYVSFLDDDDLALPVWVEGFRTGARRGPNRLVRVPCLSQRWTGDDHGQPLEPIGDPEPEFPAEFDLVAHFHSNATPICAMALPRQALIDRQLRFDDDLPVLEDWDLLLQTVLACGIENVTEPPGSIYRRVDRGNSSDHTDEEWIRAKERIIARLDSERLTLPAGSASLLGNAHQARLDLSYQIANVTDETAAGSKRTFFRRR